MTPAARRTTSPAIIRQITANRGTRTAWDRCAPHRRRLHAMLSAACAGQPTAARLCVLGAGNCNDLDLRALEELFAAIHLVDLDRAALDQALERQRPARRERFILHAPCDLSGVIDLPTPELRSHCDTDALQARIRANTSCLAGPFDVVLSAGLLTQMFQSIADRALPPAPTVQLVLALRQAHLHTLFDLTRRGGAFILLTDVVSTATAPQLRSCADAQLGELLAELIEARNFFTGTNPAAIWQTLASDAELAGRCAARTAHDPWRWPVTRAHEYLAWAVSVRTR